MGKRVLSKEDRELLLKNMCARLPYGIIGKVYAEVTDAKYDMNGDMIFFDAPFDVILDGINVDTEEIHVTAIGNKDTVEFIEEQQGYGLPYTIEEFKPYLRPMPSITEEERSEVEALIKENRPSPYGEINNKGMDNLLLSVSVTSSVLNDWLLKNHFDFRGLLDKGLAICVTDENNPY